MKTFILDNKEIKIPESWDEVTLEQLIKISIEPAYEIEIIEIFAGVEIANSKDIKTFEEIRHALRFIMNPPDLEAPPKEIVFLGEKITTFTDVGQKSIGQYIDLSKYIEDFHTIEGEEIDLIKRLSLYPKIIAIYLQPVIDKSEYDFEKAEEYSKELYKHSAVEVSAWGYFFIRKFIELRNGILQDVQSRVIHKKKERRVSLIYLKTLVSRLCYSIFRVGIFKSKITS